MDEYLLANGTDCLRADQWLCLLELSTRSGSLGRGFSGRTRPPTVSHGCVAVSRVALHLDSQASKSGGGAPKRRDPNRAEGLRVGRHQAPGSVNVAPDRTKSHLPPFEPAGRLEREDPVACIMYP
jgi:hypothetical protein